MIAQQLLKEGLEDEGGIYKYNTSTFPNIQAIRPLAMQTSNPTWRGN